MDGQVIDGHIVPNVVLFARTAINGRPVQTLSFKDDLKITVAFNNDTLPTNDQESRGKPNSLTTTNFSFDLYHSYDINAANSSTI